MSQEGTLTQALARACAAGLNRLDAQMLMLTALERPVHERAWLLTHDTDVLTTAQLARFEHLAARRLAGEPMAYIIGQREFFGLMLKVDSRVLDPRPDTETLVEWALEVLAPLPEPLVVDLGTGSGAIALALCSQRPDAHISAVDASADALDVARANAQALQLPLECLHGSWLRPLAGRQFDAIVSNPPYIAQDDPHLAALTREPLQALASGADGLDDLRTLIAQAPEHLAPGGWLLLEHGHDQANAVRALLQAQGFIKVQSRDDLAGIARCSGGQWPTVK